MDRIRYQRDAEAIRAKKLEYWRAQMKANPERVRERQRQYFKQHPEKRATAEYFRLRYLALSTEQRKAHAAKLSQWSSERPDRRAAHEAKRRASKRSATPKWANDSLIAEFFAEAKRLTEATGVKHQVDHIVPLTGKRVCGLHVEANLRVITAAANQSKLNRYWPDMP
ncbi:MAG: hypothetical protein KGL17_02345 [Betaproteobacteria bacterium]|nr:hypothetical protein [Betaproteobacteria bacterium]